jgi:hypothetical protein
MRSVIPQPPNPSPEPKPVPGGPGTPPTNPVPPVPVPPLPEPKPPREMLIGVGMNFKNCNLAVFEIHPDPDLSGARE